MPISSIVVLELFILNIQKFLPLLWIKLLHISIILLWQSYWRKAFCYHCPLSILVEYEENGTRHFYFWFFCAPYYSIIKQLTNPPAAMPCRGMVTKMFRRRYRKLPGQKTRVTEEVCRGAHSFWKTVLQAVEHVLYLLLGEGASTEDVVPFITPAQMRSGEKHLLNLSNFFITLLSDKYMLEVSYHDWQS